jgi:predicted RNA polymerase sigma factor
LDVVTASHTHRTVESVWRIDDDLLRLVFTACHPVLSFERAASLTRNERERTLLLGRAAACARH